MARPHRSSRTRSLLLSLGVLVLMALLAEVALRVAAPVADPYHDLERLRPQVNQYIRLEYPRRWSAITEVREELPGLSGQNDFTTNSLGFRGGECELPKPPGEWRVFLVGGSSIECFYLDDDDEVGRVAQGVLVAQHAGARVYNIGLSGAASDDHVAMVSQRLVHLEPDVIVVMAGVNDLLRSMHGYDYLHYVDYRPAYRKPWYKRLAMQFQLARRVHYLRARISPDPRQLQEERPLVSNYAGAIGLQRTVPASDTAVARTDTTAYARNLRTLAGIAHAHGIQLVFVTQPSTWNSTVDPHAREWHWMRHRDGITYREDIMDRALESLNDAMRRVSVETSVPVYDLAREIPKSLEYFYDDCHFNVSGARAAGEGLAAFLSAHRGQEPPVAKEEP